jgi:hypothetical protein
MHMLDVADGDTAKGRRALGPCTDCTDNFVERLAVGNGPVDKLAVHIIFHNDLLRRAGLFFRPRDISRGPPLQQVEDLRGNIDHVLVHTSNVLHFSVARLVFRTGNANVGPWLGTGAQRAGNPVYRTTGTDQKLTKRLRAGSFIGMSGKELAKQVATLSDKEREAFISELLSQKDIAEDLGDILLVRERRNEPSIPFSDVVERLKRDKLV